MGHKKEECVFSQLKLKHLTKEEIFMSDEKKVGDPTALGLFAYGIALTLLAAVIGGFAGPFNGLILGTIIFTGGVGLVLAGVYDFMRGSAFGGVAFTGWGLLFLTVSTFFIATVITKAAAAPAPAFGGWFHLLWAIFGFATFFGANVLKKWVMLQIALFLTSAFLFNTGYRTLYRVVGGPSAYSWNSRYSCRFMRTLYSYSRIN